MTNSIKAFVIGSITSLALFGLILGGLWQLVPASNTGYKLSSALLAAALAVVGGGLLFTLISAQNGVLTSAIFGCILCAISFGYIFGPAPLVLVYTAAGAILASFGGWIGQITRRIILGGLR